MLSQVVFGSRATYVIKVCDNPTPLISGNDQICAGNNTSLSSTGGTSYIWSNGMTACSITVSPTVTTTIQ
ncbi:MAG: hypothetical protein IPO48_21075 [Saprospiraceae bacterium]|nr:hypothetical protein [Saprospiraceae bacterium]